MGFGSWWHWVLLLIVVLVVFGGKGKVSDLMGDVAKGIKSFKKGLPWLLPTSTAIHIPIAIYG